MTDTVILAALSLLGTLLGTFGGILTANKLTNYRIEQLEKKVEGLGAIIEKTYKLEEEHNLFDEKFKVVNHRIADLERRIQ